ncbi:FxsB family cyclophane-forming radical SAM/SPASM peptide maturase [Streptomyces sp. NPDC002870]|uniref:FxsB family cyclophane-forming radical SAM/SPASM peptide maturase n=1 Tax=Streptomyces sp. NPDC002870 TaxID=3364666 RepID=UPI003691D88C
MTTAPSSPTEAGHRHNTSALWPLQGLDVAAARAAGHQAVPFQQFVLKMHSRCNFACTYCYVYSGPDQSWRRRPRTAPAEVVAKTATRIADHAKTHMLSEVHLNVHGGEPLLTGAAAPIRYVTAVREAIDAAVGPGFCQVQATLQTNGSMLTEGVVTELADAGLKIGVSLDGGRARHNRHRVDHRGRPGWPAASRGLRVLARHPDAYGGILCTIDPSSNPIDVYESLLSFTPPSMDLLLPHTNWSSSPGRKTGIATPYGNWLADVFDHWFHAESPQTTIRLFTEIIGLLTGQESGTESVGSSPVVAVVVDTDGAIEQVDSLKTAYSGAPETGLNVFHHTFNEALDHPGIAARQIGTAALSDQCLSCPVVGICGGGNYAHRFDARNGFRNPSVHCADLERLIRHIADRLRPFLLKARLPRD